MMMMMGMTMRTLGRPVFSGHLWGDDDDDDADDDDDGDDDDGDDDDYEDPGQTNVLKTPLKWWC